MERTTWTDERLDDAIARIDQRFDGVDRRLDRMEENFDRIWAEFAALHRLMIQVGFTMATAVVVSVVAAVIASR